MNSFTEVNGIIYTPWYFSGTSGVYFSDLLQQHKNVFQSTLTSLSGSCNLAGFYIAQEAGVKFEYTGL